MDFLQQSDAIRVNITRRTDAEIAYILQTFSGLPVHPIFQHNRWPQITPAQWVRIQPALVMASFFITCPLAEDFWHGVLFGLTLLDRHRLGQPITRFDLVYNSSIGNPVPLPELHKVHQILAELPRAVTLFIRTLQDDNVYGLTETISLWPFHHDRKGYRSRVILASELLDLAEIASREELLRIWLSMAITLAHETAHALYCSYYALDEEMVFRDSDKSEIGGAFEEWVFGGPGQDSRVTDEQVVKMFYQVLGKHGIFHRCLS